MRTLVKFALLSLAMSAQAADYYVVVPVAGRTAKQASAQAPHVSLNSYTLPAGVVGTVYPGFDFNTVLQVLGDSSFSSSNVVWSLDSGSLPAG